MSLKNKFILIVSFIITNLIQNSISKIHNYILSNECTLNDKKTLYECSLESNNEFSLISNFKQEKIISKLKVEIRNLEGDSTYLKIFDEEKPRYEVPRNVIEYFELKKPFIKFTNKNLKNLESLKKGDPFILNYLSDDGNENDILFTLFEKQFVFMDDFISYNYNFFSNHIFGYGERSSDFKLKPGTYTTWPRDVANSYDDGMGAKNSYGHQPFFLHRKNSTCFLGFAFINSNAQDLTISEKFSQMTNVNQITIGGIIELIIFNGNTPMEVIKKFHNIIGKPALPNFWALGWHQSRWGYSNTSQLNNVIENYEKHKIPIDTIWSDIDYLKDLTDFDYDHDNYKDLPKFIEKLKNKNMHYVPIIDMGIPNKTDDKFFQMGKELDVFIKSNYTKDYLYNNVWPGICVYPDFTKYEDAKTLWFSGLEFLNENIKFDGIWLDMNEPSGFVKGELGLDNNTNYENNVYLNLTYMPGNGRDFYSIENSTLSSNGIMSDEYAPFNTIYNLKPINAFYENKITYEFFSNKLNKRSFILSRSSFMGMNRYTSHWLGDNFSTFDNMTRSIAGIFNFQMFGFNQVGADICGLLQDTTDELCARWIALGSFYPFSRNHNNKTAIDQEPYNLGEKTLSSAKKNIRLRYSLLRYFYSQMYISSLEGECFSNH